MNRDTQRTCQTVLDNPSCTASSSPLPNTLVNRRHPDLADRRHPALVERRCRTVVGRRHSIDPASVPAPRPNRVPSATHPRPIRGRAALSVGCHDRWEARMDGRICPHFRRLCLRLMPAKRSQTCDKCRRAGHKNGAPRGARRPARASLCQCTC